MREISRTKSMRTALLGAATTAFCVIVAAGFSIAQQTAATVEPESGSGPALVRRLTEDQYRATIADVFAPDIAVVGRFENPLREGGLIAVGTSYASISPFAVEQYDASARGIAADVVSEERRAQLVPCQPRSPDRFDRACATRFVEQYGRRLFRRPLTRAERDRYVQIARSAQEDLDHDFYTGLEIALTGLLVAPEFLLRVEHSEPDPRRPGQYQLDAYSKAARLSYMLTGSTPDDELLRAAGAGELDTEAGLARQADRLLNSPHLERAVRAFFRDMMEFERFDELAKDSIIYPAFNSTVAADAQEQTLRTIVDVTLTQHGDYRDIFTTRRTHLTRALGAIYRMPVATRNGWEEAEYPAGGLRAGILTNISFLALYSHPGRSSPTIRGVALRKVFLCQDVPDPPPDAGDFTLVNDTSNPNIPTARQRLEQHRTNPVCAACHRLMDPLGLTLENFDGAGAYRQRENNAVIDASGALDGREFERPDQLGQAMHDHPQAARCLVDKFYRSSIGRTLLPSERPWIDYLNRSFIASGYRLPELMRAIATSRAFYAIAPPANTDGDRAESATHRPS